MAGMNVPRKSRETTSLGQSLDRSYNPYTSLKCNATYITVDNHRIVPYNPYPSMKCNGHIHNCGQSLDRSLQSLPQPEV